MFFVQGWLLRHVLPVLQTGERGGRGPGDTGRAKEEAHVRAEWAGQEGGTARAGASQAPGER